MTATFTREVVRVGSLLDHVVRRWPLRHGGFSGAGLEHVLTDGAESLVLKRVCRDDDWLMRAARDEGRIGTLWESGVFARIPSAIDHAVVAVERDAEGWLVFMRDVSTTLFGDTRVITRAENLRILAAAAALHNRFWDEEPLPGLCRLAHRYASLSPATAAREPDPSLAVPSRLRPGWEAFADIVAADVADGILAILERPSLLAEQLEARPCTLVHGDLKLANLGFGDDRVVMLDWGSWTGFAPPAVELAWYIAVNWSRIDASREQVIEDFRSLAAERFDETALRLGLVGGLVQLGWNKALDAATHPDEALRRREQADLDWWVARAREAFETWYPA
jgi:hypothetical protein